MDVRGYVEANASEFIDDLKQWLTIPSISADPARHGDVGHSAAWLAGHLRGAGFPVAQVLDTGGLPAVYAEWRAADPSAPAQMLQRVDVEQRARAVDHRRRRFLHLGCRGPRARR